MTVLVVSATASEAAHVPSGLPVLITGVGKTAAAVATARALAADPAITEVINIGTAGALHPGVAGLHEIGRVLNHDLSYEIIRTFGEDPQEWLHLDPAAPTRLATGDVFLTDSVHRDQLAQLADLVDMEGYAVAYAARAAGVPVRLVKHVSDQADERSLSWPELVDLSARELGAWLADHVPAQPEHTAESEQPWFAVRCVLEFRADDPEEAARTYEERITLWRAADAETAITLAEAEVAEYADGLDRVRYLGLAQSYEMFDTPEPGAEIFSLMRDSKLAPPEYVTTFFDTGDERLQDYSRQSPPE